jgi:hypothetical protein
MTDKIPLFPFDLIILIDICPFGPTGILRSSISAGSFAISVVACKSSRTLRASIGLSLLIGVPPCLFSYSTNTFVVGSSKSKVTFMDDSFQLAFTASIKVPKKYIISIKTDILQMYTDLEFVRLFAHYYLLKVRLIFELLHIEKLSSIFCISLKVA